MLYDSLDYHSESAEKAGYPPEAGGTHIGMFWAWIILHNLEGEFHHKNSADGIKAVRKGEMTGLQFLIKYCGGKLTDEDLSEKGNTFASFYYEESNDKNRLNYFDDWADYTSDYSSLFAPADTWENYQSIADYIDIAYSRLPKDLTKLRRLTKNQALTGPNQRFVPPMLERGFQFQKATKNFIKYFDDKQFGFCVEVETAANGYRLIPFVFFKFLALEELCNNAGISNKFTEVCTTLDAIRSEHWSTYREEFLDEASLEQAVVKVLEGFDTRGKEFFSWAESIETVYEKVLLEKLETKTALGWHENVAILAVALNYLLKRDDFKEIAEKFKAAYLNEPKRPEPESFNKLVEYLQNGLVKEVA